MLQTGTPVQSRTGIGEEVDTLLKLNAELSAMFGELEARIQPILLEPEVDSSASSPKVSPTISPLLSRIRDCKADTLMLISRIQSTMRRIDL